MSSRHATTPPERARRRTLRSPGELARAGLVTPKRVAALDKVAERYAVAVTPHLAGLIDPADPADPIGRQFLPAEAELERRPEELADPIGDDAHSPVKGIVHRYPDRVLLKPLLVCPVYCRFCFRRESVGPQGEVLSPEELDRAIAYVAAHPEVWEVVLTGGDPLMLPPARLADIVRRLAAIAHVAVIRLHTRVPVADPARVTADTAAALRAAGDVAVYVAVHCNHPRELTDEARRACGLLADAGIPLLAQSVLLKGVNDDVDTLEALMRALVRNRIKPYYLHHPDLAPGTAHFRLSLAEGRALVKALRGRVSGLCQPTYVLDLPGGHGKVPVGPDHLRGGDNVEDWQGMVRRYRP